MITEKKGKELVILVPWTGINEFYSQVAYPADWI